MKLSAQEVIARPADAVFAAVTDFARFEAILRARGVGLDRVAGGDVGAEGAGDVGVGRAWRADAQWRGRRFDIAAEVTALSPPERLEITGRGSGLVTLSEVRLEPLAAARTRLILGIEIRPDGIPGRIALQPVRLARGQLNARLAQRLDAFARDLERPAAG